MFTDDPTLSQSEIEAVYHRVQQAAGEDDKLGTVISGFIHALSAALAQTCINDNGERNDIDSLRGRLTLACKGAFEDIGALVPQYLNDILGPCDCPVCTEQAKLKADEVGQPVGSA